MIVPPFPSYGYNNNKWPRLCPSGERWQSAGIWEQLDLIIYTAGVMTVIGIRDYYQAQGLGPLCAGELPCK
jgi:hypothetical protein